MMKVLKLVFIEYYQQWHLNHDLHHCEQLQCLLVEDCPAFFTVSSRTTVFTVLLVLRHCKLYQILLTLFFLFIPTRATGVSKSPSWKSCRVVLVADPLFSLYANLGNRCLKKSLGWLLAGCSWLVVVSVVIWRKLELATKTFLLGAIAIWVRPHIATLHHKRPFIVHANWHDLLQCIHEAINFITAGQSCHPVLPCCFCLTWLFLSWHDGAAAVTGCGEDAVSFMFLVHFWTKNSTGFLCIDT